MMSILLVTFGIVHNASDTALGMLANVPRPGGRVADGKQRCGHAESGAETWGAFNEVCLGHLFDLVVTRWATGTLRLLSACGVQGSLFGAGATMTHSDPDGKVKVRLGAWRRGCSATLWIWSRSQTHGPHQAGLSRPGTSGLH